MVAICGGIWLYKYPIYLAYKITLRRILVLAHAAAQGNNNFKAINTHCP